MNGTQKQKQKGKPYRTPSLVVYGDIRTITQAVGATSKTSDGAMPPNEKTG